MNKAKFINFIADMHNMKKVDSEDILNKVIEAIKNAMAQGEEVKITGFGIFQLSKREAKVGNHPKTGEKIKIQAHNQPVFKVGKTLKRICNGG